MQSEREHRQSETPSELLAHAAKKPLVWVIIGGIVAVIILLMYMSYNNQEVGTRNRASAQQKNLENVYDRTWKIIQQTAQIPVEAKEAFKEIYIPLMEGRYGNARGGALMSFVKEHNPQFDMKIYDRLAAAIESQRTDFAREQTKLLDIKREHDDLLGKVPSGWFVGGRSAIEVKIVTSSKTGKAFETGADDDVELFPRKKK